MEVAGLLLGAVPLAISALRCYKTGKTLTDRVRKRKKHVEKLIRALQGHDAVLELYLVWLLKAVESYEAYHTPRDIPSLMQDAETTERIRDFLGEKGATAFQHAAFECQEAVQKIAKSIDGFLPNNKDNDDTLTRIIQRSADDVKFEFRKGIKLALGKEDVDEQITRLDMATRSIDQLHSSATAVHRMDTFSPSKKSKKLEAYLCGVRRDANRLYKTINRGWIPGCHSAHEARLILEDRVEEVRSGHRIATRKRRVSFNVIFVSESTKVEDLLWHESEVEVIEDSDPELEDLTSKSPSNNSGLAKPCGSKVAFPPSSSKTATHLSMLEIDNICLSISKAAREKKMLRLYQLNREKFHGDTIAISVNTSGQFQLSQVVTLKALISASSMTNDRSRKLSLKGRIFLALTLASTLLQLSTTPWLEQNWSKESIGFLVPISSCQSSSQASNVPFDVSRVDLKRPLVSRRFENKGIQETSTQQPNARDQILELGIMLIEIWNELPFESYASSKHPDPHLDDYFDRCSLAQRWLEELEDSFTPAYFNSAAHCIRCHFDGSPINPDWDNPALSRGLVESVIKPLQEQCRPTKF